MNGFKIHHRNKRVVLIHAFTLLVLFSFSQAQSVFGVFPQLVINEVDYDQPSTDTAEFIEIKNKSDFTADLTGYNINLINGTGGGATQYKQIILPAVSLPGGDYFVLCANAANTSNCDLDISPDSNLIQNGAPDAIELKYQDTLWVDIVQYEGDTGSPYTEGSGVGLEDDSAIESAGIARYPDGADAGQNNIDFSLQCITPGTANTAGPPIPYYIDEDGDGFGDVNASGTSPSCVKPNGYVQNRTDCDDGIGSLYPGVLNTFSDVPTGHWAVTFIEALNCGNITFGYPDGTYKPSNKVNRAEMAVYIIRALEGDPNDGYCGTTDPFIDIPYTHWACEYIKRLSEIGTTSGYPDGTYRPIEKVNRAQMAVYIIRALYGDSFSYTSTPFFPDVPNNHWAFKYVQRLYDDGISTGFGDGTYKPGNTVTRAQMATYVAKAFLGM